MELGLNEEQELLKASAEKYFRDNYSFELRRNYIETASNNNKQWKHFSDLGWLGLPLDTKYGGYSGNISDVMVLMETFGSSLVLEPYVNFIILSGKIIEKFSPSDKAALILPLIIRGERKISFAFSEPYSRYDNKEVQTIAIKDKQSWILKGMKNFVIGSSFCDQFLIPAICKEEKEIKIFLLNKKTENLVINSYENIDNSSVADITLNNLKVDNSNLIGSCKKEAYEKNIDYLIDYATLSNCSQALGIIDKMYELTLEYVKTRKQFGKKIGDFQVIQHRLVDIFIKKEEMRSLNYMAQVNMHKSDKERKRNISMNKIFLGTHANHISQECIQIHGGMGVADEMRIGHYFKRLTSLNTIFGNTDYHYERYADNAV